MYKLLRWQYNWDTTKGRIDKESLNSYWSLNHGDTWISFIDCPAATNLRMLSVHEHTIDKIEIEGLISNQFYEPVYHELIREAKELQYTNLRSAYIIAVAALETAVKNYIVRKIPNTQYLIEEIQSPPIDKLIKKYLPLLDNSFHITTSISTLTEIIKN